jgi:hypothetical protein
VTLRRPPRHRETPVDHTGAHRPGEWTKKMYRDAVKYYSATKKDENVICTKTKGTDRRSPR